MTDEALWIFIPPLSWLLYSWGGFRDKWVRRFLWPVTLAILLLTHGVTPWKCYGLAGSLAATCTLGYGDHAGWPMRWLVGLCFGLSLWWLSIQGLWSGLVMGTFLGTFYTSRWINDWPWKLSEGCVGLIYGIAVCWLTTPHG